MYAADAAPQSGPWTVRNVLDPVFDGRETQGFKAHTVLIEVDDIPGVLNEVTGVIARRGYNIQSLAVGNSEVSGRSRITTVLPGQEGGVSKLIKQLEKLVVVQDVNDLTAVPHVARELMLIKVCPCRRPHGYPLPAACVSTCWPLCLGEHPLLRVSQPYPVPVDAREGLPQNTRPSVSVSALSFSRERGCPSCALRNLQVRCTAAQRSEVKDVADIFDSAVAYVTTQTMTLEVIGTEERMQNLQEVLAPYGILEVARTGRIALARESKVDSVLLGASQLGSYV